MERKYKVLFYGKGPMGDLVRGVLESLDTVELVPEYMDPDIVFSASWPARIPQSVVERTALGAVNLHTGLLPEGRGWHPLNWALIWGKDKTGITIHKIVDSFDAGDICLQQEVPIFDTDNIVRLRERVDALVPRMVVEFFNDPVVYMGLAKKQNQAQVSYAPRRFPEDSELNLEVSPRDMYNLFRACDPVEYPAYIMENGKKKIVKNVTDQGIITF